MAIGVALLIGFTLVEARAAQPLVPLSFLRSRNRTIANTVRVCYYVGFATLFFSLSLYLQHVLNFSALATGFAFVPFGLTILVSATVLAPRLLRRFGLRTLNGGGLALSTVGYILLAGLHARGTYVADVLPGLLLVPLGGGLVLVGSTVAGLDGATGEDAGIATGLNNASMQIGSAIGLAALVSLGASHAAVLQHAGLDRITAAAQGYALSFAIAAGVTGLGALLGFFGITRSIPARPSEPEVGPCGNPLNWSDERPRPKRRKGSGPRREAPARPAPAPPLVPEVAQEPVGVLQGCRAGNRVAGGGGVIVRAGRVPVE